jgi:predicted Zn-dependent peptidase
LDIERKEIMPGVNLTALRTDKFKTGCLSLSLLTQLDRDTASMNALIPCVLRRGTALSPDMDALSRRLDGMYGTAVEPVARRIGEIHCTGFYASFPEGRFLPSGTEVMEETARLLAELLLAPNTRGGLFLPDYVDSERDKLIEAIRGRVNDRQGYALQRCIEEMCRYEAYSTLRWGDEKSAEAIRYQKLTKHYHTLLASSPIELFYCGGAYAEDVTAVLREALSSLPRGEIDWDIGTDVRMNSVEASPRETVEEMGVSQGKLVMGFRLGECMAEPDMAAIRVFNALYGGGVTSKLFANVREKLSLCYYASSILETHKGLMFVTSGIDPENYGAAKDEILRQLDAVREGGFTEAELAAAKSCFASDLRAEADSQGELEGYWLANALDGGEISPEELAALAEDVTAEQVSAVARSVECDEIYFLKPDGSAEDEDGSETV